MAWESDVLSGATAVFSAGCLAFAHRLVDRVVRRKVKEHVEVEVQPKIEQTVEEKLSSTVSDKIEEALQEGELSSRMLSALERGHEREAILTRELERSEDQNKTLRIQLSEARKKAADRKSLLIDSMAEENPDIIKRTGDEQ